MQGPIAAVLGLIDDIAGSSNTLRALHLALIVVLLLESATVAVLVPSHAEAVILPRDNVVNCPPRGTALLPDGSASNGILRQAQSRWLLQTAADSSVVASVIAGIQFQSLTGDVPAGEYQLIGGAAAMRTAMEAAEPDTKLIKIEPRLQFMVRILQGLGVCTQSIWRIYRMGRGHWLVSLQPGCA